MFPCAFVVIDCVGIEEVVEGGGWVVSINGFVTVRNDRIPRYEKSIVQRV